MRNGFAKAKEEGRAAYVGTYRAKKILTCVEEKESWCVFPTKLSSIIQIQGRSRQLGINFGWAGGKENEANCRGITPEELERINFSFFLDLSPIQQELISRMALPANGSINNANQSHIECQTASKIDPLSAPKIDPPLPFKLNSI